MNRDSERIYDEFLVAAAVAGDAAALSRLEDVAAFPAWAYRITTRRCQREFGRKGREPFEAEDDAAETGGPVPESASGEFAAEVSIVMAAIGTLPPDQRAALALFYLDELSVAEIAIATDVPPGTVKTRLMHARRKVRELLEGNQS